MRDAQCAPGYVCEVDSGSCVRDPVVGCTQPRDCAETETCASDGTCRVGDCSWPDIGCVEGFECTADDGYWGCRPSSGSGPEGGAGGEASSSGGAGGEASSSGGAAGEVSSSGGAAGEASSSGGAAGEVSSSGGAGGDSG